MISVDLEALSVFIVLYWICIFSVSFFIYEAFKYFVFRIDSAFGFTVRFDLYARRLVRQMRRRKGGV